MLNESKNKKEDWTKIMFAKLALILCYNLVKLLYIYFSESD